MIYIIISKYSPTPTSLDLEILRYIGEEGLFFSIFMSLFIGTDYSDRTIRNKIIVGHKRTDIYLSNFIVCCVGANIINIACIITQVGVGIPLLGVNRDRISDCLIAIFLNFFLIGAYSALFTLVSMTVKSKTNAVVASIIVYFILLIGTNFAYSALQEGGSNIEGLSTTITVNGENIMADTPNTLTSTKRRIVELITEISPCGQSIRIAMNESTNAMPLYSLAFMGVTTLAGVAIFRKKDIN
jgi:ABC-type transport system involved in multi-copper enzyme maturation permease subunit